MKHLTFAAVIALIPSLVQAQNVGIGTDSPQRKLELSNNYENFLRVHTVWGHSGIELTRDAGPSYGKRDWRIVNDYDFILETAASDFALSTAEILRLQPDGKMGIGTDEPETTLHLGTGTDASVDGGGYLTLGALSGLNMAIDRNEIQVRSNASPAHLYLQQGGGNVVIGDAGTSSRLNIENDNWQIHLRNQADGNNNNWYIGATSSGWATGDDQLIFAPNTSSTSAVLRLDNVLDNDGTVAPVAITSDNTQRLLMDGNEIDCSTGHLYLNNNVPYNTILNANDGNVSIGTTLSGAKLHVRADAEQYPLILQSHNYFDWALQVNAISGDLQFHYEGSPKSGIDVSSGDYYQYSDRRYKEEIAGLTGALDKIKEIGTYSYRFKGNTSIKRSIGVIAQELMQVYPELVQDVDGYYAVAYGPLSVIALRGIQELHAEHIALKDEVEELRAVVSELQNALSEGLD